MHHCWYSDQFLAEVWPKLLAVFRAHPPVQAPIAMTNEQDSSSREARRAEAGFQTRQDILDFVQVLRQAQIATAHLY